MTERTKACSIPPKVKKKVEERDEYVCIFCHRPGKGEAHIVPRSHGGLGIEQNLITACRSCHDLLDNSIYRDRLLDKAIEYLKAFYPGWNVKAVSYEKGEKTKALSDWNNTNLVNNTKAYIEASKNRLKTKPEGIQFFEGD